MSAASEAGTAASPQARAQALVDRIRHEMPLTAAMRLRVADCDDESLMLAVPLAPNINDKETAFAGSITSLGCITGWALLTLWAEREIGPCQVAIFDAHFAFRKPLRGDFTASVSLPVPEDLKTLKNAVAKRGRGRITLRVTLTDADGTGTVLNAAYAVWQAEPAAL